MKKLLTLSLSPEDAAFDDSINKFINKKLNSKSIELNNWRILKKSIDARKRKVKIQLKIEVNKNETFKFKKIIKKYKNVKNSEEVLIIGAGPSGLFAALTLLERGIKPIIIERGKDVRSRRRDIAAINKNHIVNPESNYCFGEGGAGTYSDGKLYTRSKKRGSIIDILETLVFHGAREDILINSQPHIGTNKLPKIIANIRETIIEYGGNIHFNSRVIDFIIKDNIFKGVVLQNNDKVLAKKTILASGHSSRDIFQLLKKNSIDINYKPFAIGVRIEHPQELIDQIQYSCIEKDPYLPPASYKLITQIKNRGVYSFCMCPGGFIVPAATSSGEIVVNGMSPSKRNSIFSNAGIVVEIKEDDLKSFEKYGALKGLYYQMSLEKSVCKLTPNLQVAPAQKMTDFINKKISNNLNKTSYQPGISSQPLHEILPPNITKPLSDSFKIFGKKMKGYLTNEANIIALESRTSSPITVPRNKKTLEHIKINNLYTCGEGAGYAGGIVSAAMDGIKIAKIL